MNRLIDSLKGFFTAASISGGELARTAKFTLDNVDWTGALNEPEPAGNPTVDTQLEAACAGSGADGSSAHTIAQALLAVADRLRWTTPSQDRVGEPDMVAFARNFTGISIIGPGGLLPSDKVATGFSLQGRDTYYPGHVHHAEESYWVIGGAGDWKVGARPWFAVQPGDTIYHASGVRHTMQTNEQAMLTVWLWTSHLDSEVVMVRG